MKKWILLLATVLLTGLTATAQSRYYVGGDISLGASSSGFNVVVYPEVGRRITPNLYAGLAAGFDWNNIASPSDFTMGIIPHLRGYLPVYERFGLSADTFFSSRFTRRKDYDPLIKTFQRACGRAFTSPSATSPFPHRSASSAGRGRITDTETRAPGG